MTMMPSGSCPPYPPPPDSSTPNCGAYGEDYGDRDSDSMNYTHDD